MELKTLRKWIEESVACGCYDCLEMAMKLRVQFERELLKQWSEEIEAWKTTAP